MKRRKSGGKRWKQWQIDYLREWYGKMPIRKLCVRIRRTRGGTRLMAWKLGICKSYESRRQTTPEAYFDLVCNAAIGAGVPTGDVHSDRQYRRVAHLRHRIWAEMHDSGAGVSSIADLSGFDHHTVIIGIRHHRERVAQMQREAAE